ncbi:MAG: AbrB/MazE/SpoVT family DNA-binding domain-containing protein [Thermaerobacter sp.]|nr:AbrB/MazE/SpoVT family DNA-binding domain-containing protein [Thermaerobacter sp.]
MALVKVQGRGQVTIPAKFREALGIEPGYTLLLQQLGERQFVVEVIPTWSLDDFPKVDVEVDMAKIREEMGRAIAERVYPGEPPTTLAEVAAAASEGD